MMVVFPVFVLTKWATIASHIAATASFGCLSSTVPAALCRINQHVQDCYTFCHCFMALAKEQETPTCTAATLCWVAFRSVLLFVPSSCLESNEFRYADSLCQKMSVFFSSRQKNMDKIARKSPSLCPCPNNVGFPSLRTKRGERGGGLSWMFLKPCFPTCGKKKTGTFNTKRASMANFSGFRATWKIATK